ncbi:MAG: ferrous iron transport protein A [Desulforegulaceae bacterium]|nr:ferrous iron transport protein A [Desulforegulaceae bacterium]
MTLDKIKPGNKCKIKGLLVSSMLGQRLFSMGIYPGAIVDVVRNAPLEDPMEIKMDSTLVSLRHAEAGCVEVEPL